MRRWSFLGKEYLVLHSPCTLDEYIGSRIRRRRRLLGLTQADLAIKIGIRFQQIQKYECADNKVSAARLHQIAAVLQTPVAYFFDGFQGKSSTLEHGVVPTKEQAELLEMYEGLPGPVRTHLMKFVRTLIKHVKT